VQSKRERESDETGKLAPERWYRDIDFHWIERPIGKRKQSRRSKI
jgi:hypothetical protein